MNDRKTFYCAHCGARLEAPAGATVTCPSCGRETQEPSRWAPRGAEPTPAPPPPEPSSWGEPTPGPGGRAAEAGPTGWGRPPAGGPEAGPGPSAPGPSAAEPGPSAGPWATPPREPSPPPAGPGVPGVGAGPFGAPTAGREPYGPGHELPPPMAPVPYQPPPGNGWAVASLVLGILGIAACLGPITGLPAIVCAIVAIRAKQPAGLAVAGLITGLLATLGGLLVLVMVALPFLMDAGAW